MTRKNLIPYLLIILLLLAAVIFVFLRQKPTNSVSSFAPVSSSANNQKSDIKNQTSAPTNNSFTDPDFGFVFKYPTDINLGRFEEGDGININLNKKTGESVAQIYISAFDEPGPVTSARIKKDIPDKVIEQSGTTKIGGVDAFVFYSKADDGSKVREYWFVNNKNLYRITTPVSQDDLTQKILATWENE